MVIDRLPLPISRDPSGKIWIQTIPDRLQGSIIWLGSALEFRHFVRDSNELTSRVHSLKAATVDRIASRLNCEHLLKNRDYHVRLEVLPWMDQAEWKPSNPFDLKRFKLLADVDDRATSLLFDSKVHIQSEVIDWLGVAVLWLGWTSSRCRSLPLLHDLRAGWIQLSVEVEGEFLPPPPESQQAPILVSRRIPLTWKEP